MPTFLKLFFAWVSRLFLELPHKAGRVDRVAVHRVFLGLAFLAVIAGVFELQTLARLQVDPAVRPILWTISTLSLMALTKLPLALVGLGLVVLSFLGLWRWYFASIAGRHASNWHELDNPYQKAIKTLNAGIIQAALILGLLIFFGLALFSAR